MALEVVAAFEKRFGGGPVIDASLRLPVDTFSITVLFGPSGSGKTTVLRCLAGLETPDRGSIRLGDDEDWFDAARGIDRSPQARRIGLLFQEYALFPHLTVAANVGYGLRDLPRGARDARVAELARLIGLEGLERRRPHELSGGERQRVALARAVAPRPRLLLLDEPLSALDAIARERLRVELRALLRRLGIPGVIVTHDRAEALALGDRMVVMDEGRVRQVGSVRDVFSRPRDLAVARIVGVETIQPATVVGYADGLVTLAVGQARLVAVATERIEGEVYVGIRGEDVLVVRGAPDATSARNRLPGRVAGTTPEGPMVRIELDCGFPVAALLTRQACDELGLKEGEVVTAVLKAPAVHVIRRG